MDMAGIKVNRNNEDSPRIRKLREAIKEQDKNLDTPAAQRMRQRTRVPDSISGKPPELRQGNPFKGSKKVVGIKKLFADFERTVVVPPENIRETEEVFKKLNDYMKKYPLSTNKFLKEQGMTPDDIKNMQRNFIKGDKDKVRQRGRLYGITTSRPKKRGGKVLANSTRKAKYKAG